jgi:hypothetical protein
MTPQAKPGDIIKLTKLRAVMMPGGAASPERPSYFLVEHAFKSRLMAQVLLITHRSSLKDLDDNPYFETGRMWAIANNDANRLDWGDGHYEIVSEDEVPDYVWAEIAKRKLLGEDDDDEEA